MTQPTPAKALLAPAVPSPAATPVELFVTLALIAERGHEMHLPPGLYSIAKAAYADFVAMAKHRGAWNSKTEKSLASALRERLRTGKLAPRAMRIAGQVIGCLTQHELAVIVERMRRFGAMVANDTPETLAACRAGPTIDLRARQLVDEVKG